MFRRNHLKSALLAGVRCTGAWLFSGSPAAGEILGTQGFDALVIDQEHTAHGPETTIAQMRAVAAAGPATMLVRVPDGESRTIKLALDSGAEGIFVPTVESAEEARAIVAACRYPPDGRRGAHHTVARAADWGRNSVEYLRHYSAELLIIAMIESERGLNAAADIAAVDGIDMLFLGPLDLSASLGCMGDFADPRITDAADQIARACAHRGKSAGSTAFPGFSAPRLFALGHGFVTLGSDVTFLHAGAAASLREVEETTCNPAK
ncbi:MAG TPA: aldolase/citrate lyase family protein [Steroidobacteraceae bacterium]|nr:aldolase/citrate lyase family protein [Steroidobacteraceae bacterium]